MIGKKCIIQEYNGIKLDYLHGHKGTITNEASWDCWWVQFDLNIYHDPWKTGQTTLLLKEAGTDIQKHWVKILEE